MMEVTGGISKRRPSAKIFVILGAVVMLLALAAAGYFYWQYNRVTSNPNVVAQDNVKRLKGLVGKLYQLPTDEEPTVAQIQDKEKLKDQTFFKNAENGDYILIYTNAKLALLYREKENKLINVGPITISDTSQTKDNKSTNKTNTNTNTTPTTQP